MRTGRSARLRLALLAGLFAVLLSVPTFAGGAAASRPLPPGGGSPSRSLPYLAPSALPPARASGPVRPGSAGPAVASTTVLWNNTVVPGNYVPPTLNAPGWVVYDSGRNELFAGNDGDSVGVVSASSNGQVTAQVPISSISNAAAYDPAKGAIYVTEYSLGTAEEISDASDRVVGSVGVGVDPEGIAYDAGEGELFVTNLGPQTVTVVNDTSNSVVATIPVGQQPWGIAYDAGQRELFVANAQSDNVSVIDAAPAKVVATIPVGSSPEGVAYDPSLGEIFVVNDGSGNVSVINDTSDRVVTSIPVASSIANAIYDAGQRTVYVSEAGSASDVVALSPASNSAVATIPVGIEPLGLAYVPADGAVYATQLSPNGLSVINDSLNAVVRTLPDRWYPQGLSDDPSTAELFEANANSDNVSVLSDVTGLRIASVPVGSDPWGVAYDAGQRAVYVTNMGSDNVSVISDRTDRVVADIPVLSDPWGLAYDPHAGEVFVADTLSDDVSVINDTGLGVVATVAVGFHPEGVAFDPLTDEIFVSNAGYNASSVSILSDATNQVVATVGVGTSPEGIAYDAAAASMVVANQYSDSLSVLSATSGRGIANLSLATSPWGLSIDPASDELFVSEPDAENVTVLNASTYANLGSVAVGTTPEGIAYDERAQATVVANFGSGTLSVLPDGRSSARYAVTFAESGLPDGTAWSIEAGGLENRTLAPRPVVLALTNGSWTYEVGAVPGYVANESGTLDVDGGSVDVAVRFSAHVSSVTFLETGLTAGTDWSVALNGSSENSTSSSVVFPAVANGSYRYVIAPIPGYTTPYASSVTVDGDPLTVGVVFFLFVSPVSFDETGLPNGAQWYVNVSDQPPLFSPTISGPVGATLYAALANGSYLFHVATNEKNWSTANATGALKVNGSTVAIALTFEPVLYDFSLAERGLPSGAVWYVNLTGGPGWASSPLSGGNASVYVVGLPNGSESYSIATNEKNWSTRASGAVTIAGAPISASVAFEAVLYEVTFTETGLPTGARWYANLSTGSSLGPALVTAAKGTTLSTELGNGTYSFYVATPERSWWWAGPNGGLSVAGAAVARAIAFSRFTYTVAFDAAGLPAGTSWTLDFAGASVSSPNATLPFSETNGSYPFLVTPPGGYSATPALGTIVVNGSDVYPTIQFSPMPAATAANPPWLLIGGSAAGVVIAALLVWTIRRRRPVDAAPVGPPAATDEATPSDEDVLFPA